MHELLLLIFSTPHSLTSHSLNLSPQACMGVQSVRRRKPVQRSSDGRRRPHVSRRDRLPGPGPVPRRLTRTERRTSRRRAAAWRTERSGSSCRAPSCGRDSTRSAPRWSSPKLEGLVKRNWLHTEPMSTDQRKPLKLLGFLFFSSSCSSSELQIILPYTQGARVEITLQQKLLGPFIQAYYNYLKCLKLSLTLSYIFWMRLYIRFLYYYYFLYMISSLTIYQYITAGPRLEGLAA